MGSDKADAPVAGDERIHLVTVDRSRGKWSGVPGKYSREHVWHFAGKLNLRVTDALAPMAYRDAVRLDPLKSFVATVASAHMLALSADQRSLAGDINDQSAATNFLDRCERLRHWL